jgi:molybdate transport system permease protein
MDWQALSLSLKLAAATALLLLPFSIWLARRLAWAQFRGQGALEAAIMLPLVLPPRFLVITCCSVLAVHRRSVLPIRH